MGVTEVPVPDTSGQRARCDTQNHRSRKPERAAPRPNCNSLLSRTQRDARSFRTTKAWRSSSGSSSWDSAPTTSGGSGPSPFCRYLLSLRGIGYRTRTPILAMQSASRSSCLSGSGLLCSSARPSAELQRCCSATGACRNRARSSGGVDRVWATSMPWRPHFVVHNHERDRTARAAVRPKPHTA